LDIKYKDIETDVLLYLKQIEQLYCIYYILKEFKEKIICISKTSSTKSLFNESIPDSAVIEYTCNKSGFTHPREQSSNRIVREFGEEKRTINYPIKNIELSETTFTTTFTKLEDKSNVLKIELPRKISENELTNILNDLESISVEGYPHILKKAHDEVKIKSKDMKRMAKKIGLYDIKTGRDMLN
jgi:NurA-like 5'-3' nuclease